MSSADKNRQMIDGIYFGIGIDDFTVNYIQDDINYAFRSLVKVWVISKLLYLLSSSSAEEKDARVSDWGVTNGLVELLRSVQCEALIGLRLLVAAERFKGADEMKPLEKCSPGSQTGGSFIVDLMRCEKDCTLLEMVGDYYRANYYSLIIKNNEKVMLHKDMKPDKRTIKKIVVGQGRKETFYKNNYSFNEKDITDAIEGLSRIVIAYLGENIGTIRRLRVENLSRYVETIVTALYDGNDKRKITDELSIFLKNLYPNTIKVIGWIA